MSDEIISDNSKENEPQNDLLDIDMRYSKDDVSSEHNQGDSFHNGNHHLNSSDDSSNQTSSIDEEMSTINQEDTFDSNQNDNEISNNETNLDMESDEFKNQESPIESSSDGTDNTTTESEENSPENSPTTKVETLDDDNAESEVVLDESAMNETTNSLKEPESESTDNPISTETQIDNADEDEEKVTSDETKIDEANTSLINNVSTIETETLDEHDESDRNEQQTDEFNNISIESETNLIDIHPNEKIISSNESTTNETNNESESNIDNDLSSREVESTIDDINNNPVEPEPNVVDDYPLGESQTTSNEDEKENSSDLLLNETNKSSIESESNIDQDHLSTTVEIQNEDKDENSTNNFSLNSSSLPNSITETREENNDDLIKIETQQENSSNLTSTSLNIDETLNDRSKNDTNEDQESSDSNNESIPSEAEDILGNKTLLKQTIRKGESNSRPTRSTLATISYKLSLIDNITSDIRLIENVSNEKIFVSECDTIPAIDICLQSMTRGEYALIDSDTRHGYGEMGCQEKQIPAMTSDKSYRMKIELELHDWQSPDDIRTLPIDERIYWGDKKRQMGNFYFRRQDYSTSLKCYNGAMRFLDTDSNPISISYDQNQLATLHDRLIQVLNNIAQVNLHLNKYDNCLMAVENVLKYDRKNEKALFRRGKALYELGKYDKAMETLKLLSQIQRENSGGVADKETINQIIRNCETKLANYQKNEKEIYQRMFQPKTTTSIVNQQRQTNTINQNTQKNNNWWPYITLASAVIATVAIVTFIKYRKNS